MCSIFHLPPPPPPPPPPPVQLPQYQAPKIDLDAVLPAVDPGPQPKARLAGVIPVARRVEPEEDGADDEAFPDLDLELSLMGQWSTPVTEQYRLRIAH